MKEPWGREGVSAGRRGTPDSSRFERLEGRRSSVGGASAARRRPRGEGVSWGDRLRRRQNDQMRRQRQGRGGYYGGGYDSEEYDEYADFDDDFFADDSFYDEDEDDEDDYLGVSALVDAVVPVLGGIGELVAGAYGGAAEAAGRGA